MVVVPNGEERLNRTGRHANIISSCGASSRFMIRNTVAACHVPPLEVETFRGQGHLERTVISTGSIRNNGPLLRRPGSRRTPWRHGGDPEF
jgi:hypothetical protein